MEEAPGCTIELIQRRARGNQTALLFSFPCQTREGAKLGQDVGMYKGSIKVLVHPMSGTVCVVPVTAGARWRRTWASNISKHTGAGPNTRSEITESTGADVA